MSIVLDVIKNSLYQINYRARMPMDDNDSTGHHPEYMDEAPATALPEVLRRVYSTNNNDEIYQKILKEGGEAFSAVDDMLAKAGLREGDLSYHDNGLSTLVLKIKNAPYVVKLSIAPRVRETVFSSIACYQMFEEDRQYKIAIVPEFVSKENAPLNKRAFSNEKLFELMEADGVMPSDTHSRNTMFFAQEREVSKGLFWTKRVEKVNEFYPIWVDKSAMRDCKANPENRPENFGEIRDLYLAMREKVGANAGMDFVRDVVEKARGEVRGK